MLIGDRVENSKEAVNAYQAALRVRTEKDYPLDWAERADGRRLLEGLRERFEIKVCGLLQICKGLFLGVALAGRADFGTLGNEPVCF